VTTVQHASIRRSDSASRLDAASSCRAVDHPCRLRDALSVAIAALRSPSPKEVGVDDHAAMMKPWARRHQNLSSTRTRFASRLHAVLCDLGRRPGRVRHIATVRTLRSSTQSTSVFSERSSPKAEPTCRAAVLVRTSPTPPAGKSPTPADQAGRPGGREPHRQPQQGTSTRASLSRRGQATTQEQRDVMPAQLAPESAICSEVVATERAPEVLPRTQQPDGSTGGAAHRHARPG
jgi:hypothetical protein